MKRLKPINGFTLLELLITITILGILVSMAVNSFQHYLQKARRVDATSALMNLAMAQERYFIQHLVYSTDIAGSSGLNYQSLITESGYYALSVKVTTYAVDGTDSFDIIATAISSQQNDDDCQQFSINQLSKRNAIDKHKVNNSTCW